MSEERQKVLELIQEGKITAAEGLELLNALDDSAARIDKTGTSSLKGRFLRVRVYTADSTKVNINVPLGLVKAASKFAGMGMKFIPEEARREMEAKGIDLNQMDFEELIKAIEEGVADEKIVDIDVDDPKEGKVRVEVYVD